MKVKETPEALSGRLRTDGFRGIEGLNAGLSYVEDAEHGGPAELIDAETSLCQSAREIGIRP